MTNLILLVLVFYVALLRCVDAQLEFPRDEQAPYLLVSPERLKQLIDALKTKEKVELLLGPPAKQLENGFHIYYVMPLSDLELFPACVTGVRIFYRDNKVETVEVIDEILRRNVAQGLGTKYKGMINIFERREADEKKLEQQLMNNSPGMGTVNDPEKKRD